jgi:hypothetical protein
MRPYTRQWPHWPRQRSNNEQFLPSEAIVLVHMSHFDIVICMLYVRHLIRHLLRFVVAVLVPDNHMSHIWFPVRS